jgi:hypothetical protein
LPFLRLIRDQRGYENTLLLHAARHGERPRVLYWYRSAPGVRVGRPPLDATAMEAIETEHPDIQFDWGQILKDGAAFPPDIEARPERPRRRPARPREPASAASVPVAAEGPQATARPLPAAPSPERLAQPLPQVAAQATGGLLEDLVGREIAARLRGRYLELAARLDDPALDPTARDAWRRRAVALDPDAWTSAEAILRGVEQADRLFDELRREIGS